MTPLPSNELALALTRRFIEQIREACPSVSEAFLDDLTEELLAGFSAVADTVLQAEQQRRRPAGWN